MANICRFVVKISPVDDFYILTHDIDRYYYCDELIDIDAISLELYISGYLLWKFNLSAGIIFSPDFIRIILLILVLFLT